ncbi:hypothetical protein GSI_00229 [Ganoderma sinense ZZ0214-1]|uniref:Retrovirus-related Pol polyprotein from transposon TNT 1-94-like beta-barrel domain-containing protein n=1 Tax=Ganoderma sinense ZZ0214-1 TaxID=1077348 RepID=A0A2G8SS04_9APHY|nr:hypothetical protein GSI_00229 [Ganoderma sinense ZZ0214-1]
MSLPSNISLATDATITDDPNSVPDWVQQLDYVALAAVHSGPVALTSNDAHPWYLDSGASMHLSPIKSNFTSLRPIAPHAICGVNSSVIHVTTVGTIKCPLPNGHILELINVLYVPTATVCLISIRALCDSYSNYTVTFSRSGMSLRSPSGNLLFQASRNSNTMFTLNMASPSSSPSTAFIVTHRSNIETIHHHYSHPSYSIAYNIAKHYD